MGIWGLVERGVLGEMGIWVVRIFAYFAKRGELC